jgi:hypothetical protein
VWCVICFAKNGIFRVILKSFQWELLCCTSASGKTMTQCTVIKPIYKLAIRLTSCCQQLLRFFFFFVSMVLNSLFSVWSYCRWVGWILRFLCVHVPLCCLFLRRICCVSGDLEVVWQAGGADFGSDSVKPLLPTHVLVLGSACRLKSVQYFVLPEDVECMRVLRCTWSTVIVRKSGAYGNRQFSAGSVQMRGVVSVGTNITFRFEQFW